MVYFARNSMDFMWCNREVGNIGKQRMSFITIWDM